MNKLSDYFFQFLMSVDIVISKLDNYFEKRKKSEVYIVYLTPIILVGYLSVELLLPMMDEALSQSKVNLRTINDQINTYKSSLATIKDGRTLVDILEEKNAQLKKQIEVEIDRNYFIQSKIDDELNSMKYNKRNWSNYLFYVTEIATENKVAISSFSNSINTELKFDEFSKVMNVDINATGNFVGVMNFLDTIERDKRVVEITDLSMSGQKDILFGVHLDIWGIK